MSGILDWRRAQKLKTARDTHKCQLRDSFRGKDATTHQKASQNPKTEGLDFGRMTVFKRGSGHQPPFCFSAL